MDEEVEEWFKENAYLLGRLKSYLKEKIWIIFCGLLAGQICFLLIDSFLLKPTYEARTSLYISNVMNTANYDPMDINDITASQQLVNTYIALLEDESVLSGISERLTENFTPQEINECWPLLQIGDNFFVESKALAKSISMEAESNTEILRISVRSGNREISIAVCRYMKDIAEEVFKTIIQAGAVNQIGEVEAGLQPEGLDLMKMGIVGGGLGLVLTLFLLLATFVVDARIQNVEEVKAIYKIPILGVLPRY